MFRRARRRIEWTETVKVQVLQAAERWERLYEVIKNLEWLLERQPDNAFAEQLDEEFWLIKSESLFFERRAGIPGVLLIYRFDDEVVTFWNVRVTPPGGAGSGG